MLLQRLHKRKVHNLLLALIMFLLSTRLLKLIGYHTKSGENLLTSQACYKKEKYKNISLAVFPPSCISHSMYKSEPYLQPYNALFQAKKPEV